MFGVFGVVGCGAFPGGGGGNYYKAFWEFKFKVLLGGFYQGLLSVTRLLF